MKISPIGLAIIKGAEGLRLSAYPDPGSGGEPWTIGYGHTGGVRPGDEISEEQAEELLKADLDTFEECVDDACQHPLTQGQFDGCVSLAFNIGCKAFSNSTLVQLLNSGESDAAAQQFKRWNKAAGKVLPGLVRRREAERQRFIS